MPDSSSFPSSDTGHASSSTVNKGVESAGAALHSGIDKVSEPVLAAVDRLSTAAHSAVDKISSSAVHTAERFSDQTQRVTQAPSQALAYSKSRVQSKPLEAVAAALAIGFILGRLTGR